MANKTIQSLPTLTSNNYDPDQDMFIVQKPNGATHKMTATNVMNPVAGGMTFLNAAIAINTNQNGYLSYNTSAAGVPINASNAMISIRHNGSSHPNLTFAFYTVNHGGADSPTNKHNFEFNHSDKSQGAHNSLWVPIINGSIYYYINSDNTWNVFIHAYA